jgi:LysR family transcriptional regulator, transcriptional activator of nhaA
MTKRPSTDLETDDLRDLNLHHLRYAWTVAREGSIRRAADRMGVTASTVSAQVSALESRLGASLFLRHGNRLELTPQGELVLRYANEIFTLAERLVTAVVGDGGPGSAGVVRLALGMTETLPILTARTLLAPVLALPPEGLHLTIRVGPLPTLLGELGGRVLDAVLTDTAVAPSAPLRVIAHPLATSPVALFAEPGLAERLRPGFPFSLDGAPFLLHTEHAALRAALDGWFARLGIRPLVTAEVEDVGFLQLLGQDGRGVFAAPALVAEGVMAQYRVEQLGVADGVTQDFHALILPGRGPNPALDRLLSSRPIA